VALRCGELDQTIAAAGQDMATVTGERAWLAEAAK
jgi:hypothetical protein